MTCLRTLTNGVSMCNILFFLPLAIAANAQRPIPPALHPDPVGALTAYRANLTQLRQEHPNPGDLPDLQFFLFGMGNRLKIIYRDGRLINALTGNIEEQWRVKKAVIVPSENLVTLELNEQPVGQPQTVQIREDENGVWILQPGKRPKLIPGTRSSLVLPRFADNPYGPVLRVLHHEVLINVIHGRPVPNFLAYAKPRYRDAALMAMVLRETGNLPLIHDWIMAIRDPFDRSIPGHVDADNPGQVLFLAALVSNKTHPAVPMALDSVAQFRRGNHIAGQTDGEEHPVFQTRWLKYGLKSLGLPDPYVIPTGYDPYASRCWWANKSQPTGLAKDAAAGWLTKQGDDNPGLVWAQDHFYDDKRGPVGNVDYPMSWQKNASGAHYPGLTVLEKALVRQKLTFPHAGHAAEMFMRLVQE